MMQEELLPCRQAVSLIKAVDDANLTLRLNLAARKRLLQMVLTLQ